MVFASEYLNSATEKLGMPGSTRPEIAALVSLLGYKDDEVSGFGFDPVTHSKGRQVMGEISGIERQRWFDRSSQMSC